MQRLITAFAGVTALIALTSCTQNTARPDAPAVEDASTEESVTEAPATESPAADNVLLAEWTGPYGGVPAFDQMDLEALKPALEAGMKANLEEIDAIAGNSEPPTFENTILPLERTGRELSRAFTYFRIWSGNVSSPEFRQIQQEMAPKLSQFNSKITQNQDLFRRVKTVYESRDLKQRSDDEQRLVKLIYDGFASGGATLEGEAKERYAAINERLAELHTRFANNVLADEEGYALYLTEDQLGGLSESFKKAAAAAATADGEEGKYKIANTRSSMEPFLTYSTERDLREKVWRNYVSRGDNGDEHDNNALIPRSSPCATSAWRCWAMTTTLSGGSRT